MHSRLLASRELRNEAVGAGIEVRVRHVGLADVELHIARVRSRVKKGGHDIPETKIRERYVPGPFEPSATDAKLTELLVDDQYGRS